VQAAHAAKEQYKQQKPEFHKLVSDNEKLQEELKRKQKQLLKINLDKYFLFERLLSYEKPPPRKYTKQPKSKSMTDAANADENTESQSEMSISTPPSRVSKNEYQAEKRGLDDNEENLEVDVDTEEDIERPGRISLLKLSKISRGEQKEKKSVERKKYKKRRKSVQNSEDRSSSVTMKNIGLSMSSQPIPGGTSLLLSSFSPQHNSRGQP
jgi:hypothetical protein